MDGNYAETIENFVYDGTIGNPTTYRGKTATWTNGRHLASYDGYAFTYDTQGRRIAKGNISFTYDSNGRVVKQSNGLEFFYDHTGVAGLKYGGATYVYRKDAQGNIIAIINQSGNVVVEYTYDAWGNHTFDDISGVGLGTLNPFRYRGYYYDTETKRYFLKTRYYDPEIGRFMTIDGIEYLDPETINGLNLYAYCRNNPIMYADPSGHLPEWAWKLIIGTVFILAGAFVTAATAGAATAFWAAFGSALLTSTIQVGIGTAVSAGLGFIAGGLSTGTWEGAFTGMIDGAVDGYMRGGIISGGSQILSGLMKVGNGISAGRVDALYKSKNSTTLFNYNNATGKSRFRIDVAKGKVKYPGGKTGFLSGKELNGLHYHFGKSNSLRDLHRFFTPGIVNGFISFGLGFFF